MIPIPNVPAARYLSKLLSDSKNMNPFADHRPRHCRVTRAFGYFFHVREPLDAIHLGARGYGPYAPEAC